MTDLENELFKAVTTSDVELIKELLSKGASPNTLVPTGQTILGQAVQLGDLITVGTLLDAERYAPVGGGGGTSSTVSDTSTELDLYLNPTWFQWQEPDAGSFQTSSPERSLSNSGCGLPEICQSQRPNRWELGLFKTLRRFSAHWKTCDVNLADYYDRMPIHYAAELGNPRLLQLLLDAECRVNVSDSKNLTPLHFATGKGHEEVTEILLRAGSRVNSKTSDKSSALHIAASRGYWRICEQLLNYGAKIDILDASDRSPLFLAVSRSHHQVVKILLSRGAKVNVEEIHGYTPLSEAVFQKDCTMVSLLLESGAKVTASHHLLHYSVHHRSLSLARLLLDAGVLVNRHDDCGDTPLHLAVRGAHINIVEHLIKYGADINGRNLLSGQSLAHEAVEGITEENYLAFSSILSMLLHRGCKLNVESFTPGDTPLYRAILLDKYIFAEELIRHGSNVNLGNVYSCNIDNLCLASHTNQFRIVRLLVYAGFDLWQTPWLEILPASPPLTYPLSTIKGWLIHMKSNPLNLMDSCRIVIRKSIGENLVSKVCLLTVPEPIKRFLLLENVTWGKEMVVSDTNNANVVSIR